MPTTIGRNDISPGGEQEPTGISDRPLGVSSTKVPSLGGPGSKGPGIGEGSPAARGGKPNTGRAV